MSYEDRQKADLAQSQILTSETHSMGQWAKGIRHGWIKRKTTVWGLAYSQGDNGGVKGTESRGFYFTT